MSEGTPARVYARTVRPDGTPAHCARCGCVCRPCLFGPPLCPDHQPRMQGSDPAARRAMTEKANAARAETRKRRQTADILAVRAGLDTAPPRGHRERVLARLKAKGLL